MELLSNLLAIAINLWVGARILRRASGSGPRPERLLGWALVCDGLEWLCWVLSVYTPLDGTPSGLVLGVLCRIGIAIAAGFLLAFTWAVFHPGARWAGVLMTCVLGAIWLGMLGSLAIADWHGYRTDLVWVWMESAGVLVAYGWTFVAAATHYRRARRRLALELGDPLVTNRILLWSIFGGAIAVSQVAYLYALTFANKSDHYPAVFDTGIGALTIVACVAIWLAFFPPRRYRRWVESSRPARG